jgi:hypothetical protein
MKPFAILLSVLVLTLFAPAIGCVGFLRAIATGEPLLGLFG